VDPQIESRALEIQYIEVSKPAPKVRHRHSGVREIETWHPERTLVAFSEEADGFWAS
jgi:hypothetical protein